MAKENPKRFYKDVSVAPNEGGFLIHLDGRTLKTPGKQTLRVESEHIAKAIAAEWDAQSEQVKPETMPVTRLVNVAIELTPNNRPKLIEEAKAYAGTDLLCYRASQPQDLVRRQKEQWDPILDWARTQNIDLEITDSLMAITQKPAALNAVAAYAKRLTDIDLTLLVHLTAVFGSTVLAIAVMEKHLIGSQAFELSRLDALYQIEQWGDDEEAQENAKTLAAEVDALCSIIGA